VAELSLMTVKCGGLDKDRGGMWAAAGEAGEGMFTEDRSCVFNIFCARFASESRFGPELEHRVAN
jgi:hypothetical protein